MMNGTSRGEDVYRSVYKVPGGKLLKVQFDVAEGRLTSVRFTGDFFLHPEEALEEIESRLVGVEPEPDRIRSVVEDVFRERNVTAVGCGPADFAEVIIDALQRGPAESV